MVAVVVVVVVVVVLAAVDLVRSRSGDQTSGGCIGQTGQKETLRGASKRRRNKQRRARP